MTVERTMSWLRYGKLSLGLLKCGGGSAMNPYRIKPDDQHAVAQAALRPLWCPVDQPGNRLVGLPSLLVGLIREPVA